LIKGFYYLLVLPFLIAPPAFTQGFTPDAKSIALGGSLIAQARDPSAMFWNPALLSGLKDRAILLSVNDPFEFNFASFTQFVPLYGTFGFSLMRAPLQQDHLDRGMFAWGKELNRWLSFGTNLNFQREDGRWFASTNWGVLIGSPVVGTINEPWSKYSDSRFMERFSFGFTVHDIPLSEQVVETSVLMGMSYLLPSTHLLLNSGFHIQEGENTKHLGLGLGLSDRFVLYSGLEELEFDNLAFGAGFTHDNFSVNFSYSRRTEKLQFTISARISPHPEEIARPYFERGMNALENDERRAAHRNLKKYLAYGLSNDSADSARILVDGLEQQMERTRASVDSLFRVANNFLNARSPQFLRAALVLTRILELDSENAVARKQLETLRPYVDEFINKSLEDGLAQLKSQNYDEAGKMFRRILFFDKNNQVALEKLEVIEQAMNEIAEEHFYRGVGFYRQKNYQLAYDEFDTALQYNPKLKEAASYLNRTNAKIQEAEKEIEQLLKTAQNLERRGNYLEATNRYLEVLNRDKDNRIAKARIANLRPRVDDLIDKKYRQAKAYFQEEKYLEAERALEQVLSIEPQHRDARRDLNRLRLEKRARIAEYQKQAESAVAQGNWKSAEELYSKILSLDPTNAEARDGQAEIQQQLQVQDFVDQGQKLFSRGEYPQAIEKYEQALEIDPDNQVALNELQNTTQALNELVEKLFNQGINLFTLDRYEEAIEKWNEVLELDSDHRGAIEYRKQAHERLAALKKLDQ